MKPNPLAKLEALLKSTPKPLTAKQIAAKLRITRATVGYQLEDLSKTMSLEVTEVRAGKRGPWSKAFRVAP